uniref:TIGR02449 family protein n=1 Tax=Candidatus Kentrum sp. MB TaxID=2138164 RepID=A0A451BCI7_9GAMM|nr:MAG: TIGR02449 family protein [Candidatus Kentron sp. MB]VFK32626.1 MAG: TIGR02449 family protein [Candidatus Kentron sp. MB]VFK76004.1 MAG: TIGR02449 family protein [Candidatus Kentron sp. MB]
MQTLEVRINALIRAYNGVRKENQALREQKTSLMAERGALIEKLKLARVRIEAMVVQLKSMENGASEEGP